MALLPQSVIAAGWVPFAVVALLTLIFSVVYIWWFKSVRINEQSWVTTVIAICALTITLLTSMLVPVDVFLVSYMKNPDGTYKPWAEDETARDEVKSTVLHAYYACYGIILIFVFLILPLNFFYFIGGSTPNDDEQEPESPGKKLWRSVKFTVLSILVFGILVTLGIFLPYEEDIPPHNGTSDWQDFEYLFKELEADKGEKLLVFLLNVLNLIGMCFLIFYTGYGLSYFPCSMISGQRTVHSDRDDVQSQVADLEAQIRGIREQYRGREHAIPHFQQAYLERMEQQVRLLKRTHHQLEQATRSFINRCIRCCRPFQVLFGMFFGLFGFLIFLSLLLNNVDKAMHSGGPKTGYILQNGTLPNPADFVLIYAQDVFPMDYIIYTGMILFFVFCSMSGVKNIGIRCFWVSIYKIRASQTKPPALVLMCLTLMFMILALNVIMFSVVPDYTAYGSQHYISNITDPVTGNLTTKIVPCTEIEAPETECNMSRIAALLFTFHFQAWIFGAIYYWLIWFFLLVVICGSFVSLHAGRSRATVEEDEEDLLDDTNPFRQNRTDEPDVILNT